MLLFTLVRSLVILNRLHQLGLERGHAGHLGERVGGFSD